MRELNELQLRITFFECGAELLRTRLIVKGNRLSEGQRLALRRRIEELEHKLHTLRWVVGIVDRLVEDEEDLLLLKEQVPD